MAHQTLKLHITVLVELHVLFTAFAHESQKFVLDIIGHLCVQASTQSKQIYCVNAAFSSTVH